MLPRSVYRIILLLLTLISVLHADCGCNKARRSAPTPVPTEIDPDKECRLTEDGRRVCPNSLGSGKTDNNEPTFARLVVDARAHMVLIPGGKGVRIGTDKAIFPEDNESPVREVDVDAFYLDKYEVSNADFAEFVSVTGFETDAERFGDSFVFKDQLSVQDQAKYHDYRVVNAEWWFKVHNVSWRHPEGLGSHINDRLDHPVVHISWADARKYCLWSGKRLPTEAEWETGCRGGKKDKLFPWGNKINPNEKHWMNIWQGDSFPDNNLAVDGHANTCPVTKFRQNDYDLYNIVGNVWEWTSDYWDPAQATATLSNTEYLEAKRVKKGGSFLCHESYCYRYRCAARSQNTADSSASNLGFRCAMDA